MKDINCPSCRKKTSSDSVYCEQCGIRLSEAGQKKERPEATGVDAFFLKFMSNLDNKVSLKGNGAANLSWKLGWITWLLFGLIELMALSHNLDFVTIAYGTIILAFGCALFGTV